VIDSDDENLLNGARLAFRHDGREAEEAVADVMDFLVGWSSSHMRVQTFPRLGSRCGTPSTPRRCATDARALDAGEHMHVDVR